MRFAVSASSIIAHQWILDNELRVLRELENQMQSFIKTFGEVDPKSSQNARRVLLELDKVKGSIERGLFFLVDSADVIQRMIDHEHAVSIKYQAKSYSVLKGLIV